MAKKAKTKQVVDGKVEELTSVTPQAVTLENITGGKRNVRSIDELLGRTTSNYTNGTIEDYEVKIKDMTLADLQGHATSVGLLPVTNKSVLINRLLNEYKKKARGYFNTAQFNTVEPKNKEQALKAIQRSAGA